MNQRIIFALTVICSVLAASIGSSFHIAIITKAGYCILAIALLIAGFLMLVLKHTEIYPEKTGVILGKILPVKSKPLPSLAVWRVLSREHILCFNAFFNYQKKMISVIIFFIFFFTN